MTRSVMLVPTENNHLCKSLTGKDMEFLLQIISRASLTLPHDILKVWNFSTLGNIFNWCLYEKSTQFGGDKNDPFFMVLNYLCKSLGVKELEYFLNFLGGES